MTTEARIMRDRRGRAYTPAVGPRLRPLFWIILLGFAFLGANGVYLSSVTSLTWWRGTTQQTPFYMLMIALHLILGFFLIVPFVVFGVIHLADLMETAQSDGRSIWAGASGCRHFDTGLRARSSAAGGLRDSRPANPRRRILASRPDTARRCGTLCQAPASWAADPVGMGQAIEHCRRGVRCRDGAAPLPGSAIVRRQRARVKASSTFIPPKPSRLMASSFRRAP